MPPTRPVSLRMGTNPMIQAEIMNMLIDRWRRSVSFSCQMRPL
jgi:hypothetical protein